jgi:luciferase family oxidoreductase group 1
MTSQALRPFDAAQFASQLAEVLHLSRGTFDIDHPFHRVRVIPNDVDLPPIWLLGSSGASARLAGTLGLGYSFASHFSPTSPAPALDAYRASFEPSEQFPKPHAIIAVAVVCAETEERAEHLSRTMDLAWVRLRSGFPGQLPSPEEALAYEYTPIEMEAVRGYRSLHFIGTPDVVRSRIESLVAESGADEVMVSSMIHSHQERLRSYELLAGAFG